MDQHSIVVVGSDALLMNAPILFFQWQELFKDSGSFIDPKEALRGISQIAFNPIANY